MSKYAMKRARASGQTSLECWLKTKVAAYTDCKTIHHRYISVTAHACVLLQLSLLSLIHANRQSSLVTVDTVLM